MAAMHRRFRRHVWIASLAAALGAAGEASARVAVTAAHGRSARGDVDGFPFLLLRGTRAERGYAHGVLAGREIVSACDHMASFMTANTGVTWEQATTAAASVFAFSPEYEAELSAMLDGLRASVPAPERALPSLGREIALVDLKVLQTGEMFELACSQFSVWGPLTANGRVLVGRNWDYPPLFPDSGHAILAVDPDEPGRKATLDAMWFGMVGAGIGVIAEDGVVLSADDGGIPEGGLTVSHPQSIALIMRDVAETTAPARAVSDLRLALQDHASLGIIFHVVADDGLGALPRVLEYDPRPNGFGSLTRAPDPAWNPNALLMTNHFVLNGTPGSDSAERYRSFRAAVEAHVAAGTAIDFAGAVAMLDAVSRSNTRYSAVIWPAERRMRISYAPGPSTSATKGTYTEVDWDSIFGIGAGDAGAPADAGTPTDAGAPTDAGIPADTGVPADAGATADATTAPDAAGSLVDAGADAAASAPDAGAASDAGAAEPVSGNGCGCRSPGEALSAWLLLASIAGARIAFRFVRSAKRSRERQESATITGQWAAKKSAAR